MKRRLYDSRGNVTGDGRHSFTYDLANQPVAISGADSGVYTYDGNLKRVKQVVNNETIYSIYDSTGAILTRHNTTSSETTDYLSVAGQTFVRIRNGVASYPLNDHLGTALWVTDQNGNVLSGQSFNYTPFGEAWPYGGNDPGNDNQQGFTGHIEDETGLTYMQARYYDPVIGRFLQTDPIGYEDQLNLYAYVGNDPVNKVDPNGEYAMLISGVVSAGSYLLTSKNPSWGGAGVAFAVGLVGGNVVNAVANWGRYGLGVAAGSTKLTSWVGGQNFTVPLAQISARLGDMAGAMAARFGLGASAGVAQNIVDAATEGELDKLTHPMGGALEQGVAAMAARLGTDAVLPEGKGPIVVIIRESVTAIGEKGAVKVFGESSSNPNMDQGMSSGKVDVCSGDRTPAFEHV